MLHWLNPKKQALLGIDISSVSVKLVEIKSNGDRRSIEAYATEPLPEKAVESNMIKDVDAVAAAIKRALAKSKFTSRQVALAVPDSTVINKVIQLNGGLTDEEMEELVAMEADKFIPYAIDETNIDFEVLGESKKNSALVDVLIVVSRAENVSTRTEAVAKAGLEAKVVEVESYAVERAVSEIAKDNPEINQDKIIAIIDIGSNYTHLFVLHNMKIIFSREEPFGGHLLFESIAQQYDMEIKDAEEAYIKNELPEDFKETVLKQFEEMMLVQVKRTLQFFYSTSDYSTVDHILLAGGMSQMAGMDEFIQKEMAVSVGIANPVKGMDTGRLVNREQITAFGSALLLAIGLGLREY